MTLKWNVVPAVSTTVTSWPAAERHSSSNGPVTVVGAFEKKTGMSGSFASVLNAAAPSLTCAA